MDRLGYQPVDPQTPRRLPNPPSSETGGPPPCRSGRHDVCNVAHLILNGSVELVSSDATWTCDVIEGEMEGSDAFDSAWITGGGGGGRGQVEWWWRVTDPL
jgi:hypothetical protein